MIWKMGLLTIPFKSLDIKNIDIKRLDADASARGCVWCVGGLFVTKSNQPVKGTRSLAGNARVGHALLQRIKEKNLFQRMQEIWASIRRCRKKHFHMCTNGCLEN